MGLSTEKFGTMQPPRELKLSEFTRTASRHHSKSYPGKSKLSVVNKPRSSQRLAIALDLAEHCGATDSIQVVLHDDGLALSNSLPDVDERYSLRKSGNKLMIYCKGLVDEVTTRYGLDFSNVTSISFHEAEFVTIEGEAAVFVTIRA